MGSRLAVVLFADRDAPWRHLCMALQHCADPEVRAYRIHLAARTADGSLGVLPWFLPSSPCCPCGRTVPPVEPDEHSITIAPLREGGAGFPARDLGRWFRQAFRRAGGRPVVLMLHAHTDAPARLVVDVVNEARRYGFRVHAHRQSPGAKASGAWGYESSLVLAESDETFDPPAPGIAIAGDPMVCPTELDAYPEEPIIDPTIEPIPPIELDED